MTHVLVLLGSMISRASCVVIKRKRVIVKLGDVMKVS